MVTPLITQDAEWDEDVHLPTFSAPVVSQGFAEEEARAPQDSVFNRFSRDVLGNSSVEFSTDDSESETAAQGGHTLVLNSGVRRQM
jgi:hypothetical protein